MGRDHWYEAAKQEFPADFKPEPTVFKGGLDRMIQLWEKAREKNSGGYGGNRLFQCEGWAGTGSVTSCSPFTATIVGAMFDPDGGDDKKVWAPKYDNGTKPLTSLFYGMHNGNFIGKDEKTKKTSDQSLGRLKWFEENKWYQDRKTYLAKPWPYTGARWCNDSAHSLVHYNLGYEIDPRDMRRGDMVGIDWVSGHGHATFCWDVHLNDKGEVDCFMYLSSNSPGKLGVCVSTWPRSMRVKESGGKYKAIDPPIFKDDDRYVTGGEWMVLPHLRSPDVDKTTFKLYPNKVQGQDNYGQYAVSSLRVTRFWGFPPPENPHGILLANNGPDAHRLAKYTQPEPYSKGTCEKPGKGKASTKPVKKSEPEPKKVVTPEPKQQKKDETLPHQYQVECALAELFAAKWIEKDPGQPDSVADAQSAAAVADFQQKFKVEGEPKSAGPKTRRALEKALADLHAGKPNPNDKTEKKPELESFHFSPNTVEVGGTTQLGVTGKNLDLVKSYEVTLTDAKTGASEVVTARITIKHGGGSEAITIPEKFGPGSTLSVKVAGGGTTKSSDAPLHIAKPRLTIQEWVWDDKEWPPHMQDIVKQLRLTQKPQGPFEPRKITTYGVWDRMADGDTPVLNDKGKTIGHVDKKCLYLADLAATMRLDGRILNLVSSGNVFDPATGKASFDKFNPKKSKWIDVTKQAPWGMGAKMPLVPFRTIAINGAKEKNLYGKKVFISELAGMRLPTGETHNGMCIIGDAGGVEAGKQLDLFVGVDGNSIGLPAVCNVEILS